MATPEEAYKYLYENIGLFIKYFEIQKEKIAENPKILKIIFSDLINFKVETKFRKNYLILKEYTLTGKDYTDLLALSKKLEAEIIALEKEIEAVKKAKKISEDILEVCPKLIGYNKKLLTYVKSLVKEEKIQLKKIVIAKKKTAEWEEKKEKIESKVGGQLAEVKKLLGKAAPANDRAKKAIQTAIGQANIALNAAAAGREKTAIDASYLADIEVKVAITYIRPEEKETKKAVEEAHGILKKITKEEKKIQ